MDSNNHDEVLPDLEELSRLRIRHTATSRAIEATRARLLRCSELGTTPETVARPTPRRHGQVPARRIARYSAAAAAAMFVVGLGIWFLIVNLSATTAFAEVQKAIASVKSLRFRILTYTDDTLINSSTVYVVHPNLVRGETTDSVHVMNFKAGQFMSIWHKERKVHIRPIYDESKLLVMGIFAKLDDFPAKALRRVEEKIIDGQRIVEFALEFDGADAVVRVDAVTKLPIRIRVDRGVKRDGRHVSEVFTGFVFDERFDESLFAIEPPEGYAVEIVQSPPVPRGGTESLIVSPQSGLGPVNFGMSREEVIKLLGQPDSIKTTDGVVPVITPTKPAEGGEFKPPEVRTVPAEPRYTIDRLLYDSRGFRITVSSKDGVVGIHCFNRKAMGPFARDFQGKTPEGIALGASWDDVIKEYGEPDFKADRQAAFYPAWRFEFRDGKLVTIRVSRQQEQR